MTSTQLSGGQWVGPAVRLQNNGQNGYLGIYYWNSGSPQLRLYMRSSGNWTQLGSTYSVGPLAAGTQLELAASGSTVSFLVGGAPRISVTDGSFTGGAPGIMALGNPRLTTGLAVREAPCAYSVGGAVSGFRGRWCWRITAVMIFSVSGNGSFTFATPVANGSGYPVTVKTNPSGQSCTVSNGSGTVGSAERH